MKKLGIIISFLIIVIIMTGLNYLLWEREGREEDLKVLQDTNASNTLTINALTRQLENLEDTLRARNDSIDKISKENSDLKKKLEDLKQENIRSFNVIRNKVEVINNLYSNIGEQDFIKSFIIQWAEYISQEDYEQAYKMCYEKEQEAAETLEEYVNKYKNIVNSIDVKSVQIFDLSGNMKAKEQNIDASLIDEYEKGDLFLLVELDVELADWAVDYDIMFDQGINKNIFVLKYYPDSGKWFIIDIRKTA
ncbi:MAG: hypothetical protein GYA02_07770 [Clostridiaceae bacterium]|nr:hypothetical protein [Clostridiaceae bacterium]